MAEWTDWHGVDSSHLMATRFKPSDDDPERGLLQVKFKGGQVYEYENQSHWVFADLVDFDLPISKGQYFEKTINGPARRGQIKYRKVEPDEN